MKEHSSYTDYVLASETIQPEIYPIHGNLLETAPSRATMVPDPHRLFVYPICLALFRK